MSNHLGSSGTCPVLALEVPHPGNGPRQGTLGEMATLHLDMDLISVLSDCSGLLVGTQLC